MKRTQSRVAADVTRLKLKRKLEPPYVGCPQTKRKFFHVKSTRHRTPPDGRGHRLRRLWPGDGGISHHVSKQLTNADGTPAVESAALPGMPPQVLCYERADDIGFGVSGVVTRARALRASFPEIEKAGIPMAAPVGEEKVLYLLDPVGASRRSAALRCADALIRAAKFVLPVENHALNLPWTPAFLHKHDGMILSMGQFMQWVGAQVQSTGTVQIWPGTPVAEVLIDRGESEMVGRVTPCAPGRGKRENGAR